MSNFFQVRSFCDVRRSVWTNHSHHSICVDEIHPQADPKWRFFWRIGERPPQTDFNHLNAPQVIPAAFPDWSVKMDAWGNLMLAACETAAEMAAHGFHLPANAFTDMMKVRVHVFFTLAHLLRFRTCVHTNVRGLRCTTTQVDALLAPSRRPYLPSPSSARTCSRRPRPTSSNTAPSTLCLHPIITTSTF